MANKVFCKDCPCRNNDYEQGSDCNMGYDLVYAPFGNEHYHVSDNCELEVIKWAGGEFRPTLRAVDPPSALVGGGDSENTAGN